MKKILFLLLIPIIIYSQKNFSIDVDYAVFPSLQNSGLIEIYYAFPQSCLAISKSDSVQEVGGILNIKFRNTENKNIVLNKSWKFTSECDTSEYGKSLIGLLRFQLEAGHYECIATGKDINDTTVSKVINFPFIISKLDSSHFSISNIEVGTSIIQDSKKTNSMFYKNTMEITPNASGIFGKNFPVLFFYSEIYNVNKNIKADNLKVDHFLVSANNKKVYGKSKIISRKNSSIVDVGAITVNKYPSGVYNLIVAVTDTVSKYNIASIKKLFIYNPEVLDTTINSYKGSDVLTSQLATLSLLELDKKFDQSKYIANNNEIKEWKKLVTIEGKREFLHKFWKRRDLDTSTPQNETMTEYFERVKYANKHFKNFSRKEGWMTDMGRVYVIYGEPYEIERHPNETSFKPYEIWFYDRIESGVIFVFGDKTGFSDYRLMHSTKRGELEDPSWQSRLEVR